MKLRSLFFVLSFALLGAAFGLGQSSNGNRGGLTVQNNGVAVGAVTGTTLLNFTSGCTATYVAGGFNLACTGSGGTGNVSNSGTPVANQLAEWAGATTILGKSWPDLTFLDYVVGGGTAQAQTAALSSPAISLVPGLEVHWLPNVANNATAPTLAVSSLTPTTVTGPGQTALNPGDICLNTIAVAIYDGTYFQLLNPCTKSVSTPYIDGSLPQYAGSDFAATLANTLPTGKTSAIINMCKVNGNQTLSTNPFQAWVGSGGFGPLGAAQVTMCGGNYSLVEDLVLPSGVSLTCFSPKQGGSATAMGCNLKASNSMAPQSTAGTVTTSAAACTGGCGTTNPATFTVSAVSGTSFTANMVGHRFGVCTSQSSVTPGGGACGTTYGTIAEGLIQSVNVGAQTLVVLVTNPNKGTANAGGVNYVIWPELVQLGDNTVNSITAGVTGFNFNVWIAGFTVDAGSNSVPGAAPVANHSCSNLCGFNGTMELLAGNNYALYIGGPAPQNSGGYGGPSNSTWITTAFNTLPSAVGVTYRNTGAYPTSLQNISVALGGAGTSGISGCGFCIDSSGKFGPGLHTVIGQTGGNTQYTITSVNTTGVYQGTFTGCATNACVGTYLSITGFTNAANNLIQGLVTASTATQLNFTATTITETHAATATTVNLNSIAFDAGSASGCPVFCEDAAGTISGLSLEDLNNGSYGLTTVRLGTNVANPQNVIVKDISDINSPANATPDLLIDLNNSCTILYNDATSNSLSRYETDAVGHSFTYAANSTPGCHSGIPQFQGITLLGATSGTCPLTMSATGGTLNVCGAGATILGSVLTLGGVGLGTGGMTFFGNTSGNVPFGCSGAACTGLTVSGSLKTTAYGTAANCVTNTSCGSATAGMAAITTAGTTVTVTTSAVTANSEIKVNFDAAVGGASQLNVTCNTGTSTAATYWVSTRTPGTSFVISTSVTPITNPACVTWTITN